jgi:hypothetical protein
MIILVMAAAAFALVMFGARLLRRGGNLGWMLVMFTGMVYVLLRTSPTPNTPAPSPARTVIVHTITTKVIHSGMPGWGMVVIAVVALGVLCAVTLGRSSNA